MGRQTWFARATEALPTEQEADYVRDHVTMLAKMASYDVRTKATITAPAEGEPSE